MTKRVIFATAVLTAFWPIVTSAQQLAEERIKKWEPAIRAFERQDAENPSAPGNVVFVGSSSIRRWDLPKWFGENAPLNRGFGGSQIIDVNHFAHRLVLKHKPRRIVFFCGDNDIADGVSADEVVERFSKFCRIVHDVLPKTKIVVISIKPSPKRRSFMDEQKMANEKTRKLCDADERLVFVNVWTPMLDSKGEPRPELFVKDMLHLNDAGYKLWTEKVKPLLAE